ncbi:MAG: hypothetical protein ACXVJD_07080 [Mucilaginibacter sp.]
MDNLNDLKALWMTARTDSLPDSTEMVRHIKKFRDQKITKKIRAIISAFGLIAIMVVTAFVYKQAMPVTHVGQALAIVAGIILAYTNIRSIRRFYELKDCSNKEFLEFLEQTRLNQLYYYKKTQVIGLLLCSASIFLMLYEFIYTNTLLLIAVYTVAVIYLSVIWLIVRPRTFKREAKKLKATMERLETLSKQL